MKTEDTTKGLQLEQEMTHMLAASRRRVKELEKLNGVSVKELEKRSAKPKARHAVKLTNAKIEAYPAKRKGYRVHDSTVSGLILYVGKSGSKSWSLSYKNQCGKRQTYRLGSVQQFNVVSARIQARKLLGEVAGGSDPAQVKRDIKLDAESAHEREFENFLDTYYWDHHLSKRKTGENLRARIKSTYSEFLRRDMRTITHEELLAHRTILYNGSANRKALKPTTLNRDRTTIHTLFHHAVIAGRIEKNPARKEVFPRLQEVSETRVRYLGQRDDVENRPLGERQRFMNALKNHSKQIQVIVHLALNTGMRRGELFSLTWGNLNLKKNPSVTVTAFTAKTSKKRVIPLNATITSIMLKWRAECGHAFESDGLVFRGVYKKNGVHGKLDHVTSAWGALLKEAQITDFRFHDMRHDFASRLVMKRVSLYEVRDLLGHSSIVMTERYSHLSNEQLRKAVEVL